MYVVYVGKIHIPNYSKPLTHASPLVVVLILNLVKVVRTFKDFLGTLVKEGCGSGSIGD